MGTPYRGPLVERCLELALDGRVQDVADVLVDDADQIGRGGLVTGDRVDRSDLLGLGDVRGQDRDDVGLILQLGRTDLARDAFLRHGGDSGFGGHVIGSLVT